VNRCGNGTRSAILTVLDDVPLVAVRQQAQVETNGFDCDHPRQKRAAMSDPLLTISNHHSPNCGDPPIIDDRDPDIYVGYFTRTLSASNGYSHTTARAACLELRGGDAGWNSPFRVENGSVEGLVLSGSETVWLAACWDAAVNGR
jgi:hypothetical protein